MTLRIETTSHGAIEGGFFSAFTSGFRFGEFAFPTQAVHHALRHFAEKPEAKAVNLPSFGEEAFWERFSAYLGELADRCFGSSEFSPPEVVKYELERLITEKQGKIPLTELVDGLVMIPIRVSDSDDEVSFGQYKVDSENFRGLASYVIGGGWLGWNNGEYPESAQRAKVAVLHSQRPLYKGIRL